MTEHKKRLNKKKRKQPCDSMSYATGDIGLNISRFNQAFGTTDNVNIGGESLAEAKRYVRRYYIRPQNIFCSNKAEIIKALIELDDKNCSVYTLNNLGDDKDVTKLMNSDIIYYYDDGILYDKNRVKVMDYDLSIKKEEERKKFANIDKASDREFEDAYADRMTNATALEESLADAFNDCSYDVIDAGYTDEGDIIVTLNHAAADIEEAANELSICLKKLGVDIIDLNSNGANVFIFTIDVDNAFDLDFGDYNVFGERLTEARQRCCCICGEPIEGYGNNPEPYMPAKAGQACDGCLYKFVLPRRIDLEREA